MNLNKMKAMDNLIQIPIFLSSDNNYAPFVATTIASICDNTRCFCNFYILDGGITEKNKEKIVALKDSFSNFSVKFIKIDLEKEFKDIEYKNDGNYISISTYNRLLIPNLEPNIGKVIYLDVDIIAMGDISLLYKEELGNFIIGASADIPLSAEKGKKRLDISSRNTYFNAGVLLIDCKKWYENDITSKLFLIEQAYRGKLECADQDVLNKYFENNFRLLDKSYNVIYLSNKTILRHYAGRIKPWQINPNTKISLLNNFDLFWHYAKMTQFYGELLNNTLDEQRQQMLIRHLKIDELRMKTMHKHHSCIM